MSKVSNYRVIHFSFRLRPLENQVVETTQMKASIHQLKNEVRIDLVWEFLVKDVTQGGTAPQTKILEAKQLSWPTIMLVAL